MLIIDLWGVKTENYRHRYPQNMSIIDPWGVKTENYSIGCPKNVLILDPRGVKMKNYRKFWYKNELLFAKPHPLLIKIYTSLSSNRSFFQPFPSLHLHIPKH